MERRQPTVREQVRLARDAVDYLVKHTPENDRLSSTYAAAYRSMQDVDWLDEKSRASIAAMASSCRRLGKRPYANFSREDLAALEQQRRLRNRAKRGQDSAVVKQLVVHR